MDYTLQQLRYLIAVADQGSVSGAARSLYVSQPGLSAAILHLEDVFGIQLFIRHHAKGVSLTPAGQLFVKEARDVVLRALGLQQRAKELNQTVSGPLDIGCHLSIGPLLLPRVLTKLHETYPGIEARIVEGDGNTLQAQLRAGSVEVALLYEFNLDAHFEKTPLLTLPPFVLLSERHRLARQSSIQLDDLTAEPLFLLNRPEHGQYVESLFGAGSRPSPARRVGSMDLLCGMVAAGKGYSIMNVRPAYDRAFDGSPLVCIPVAEGASPLTISLVCAGNSVKTNRVNAFLEVCQSLLDGFDTGACRWMPERIAADLEHAAPIAASEQGSFHLLGFA